LAISIHKCTLSVNVHVLLRYKKLFFGLAFFHAIIQERRKFGAIGWNIPYSWMNSDLQTSKAQLRMYLDEQAELPLETLNYIIGEVNYGGRITDDKDQRCCRCILSKYMCERTVMDVIHSFFFIWSSRNLIEFVNIVREGREVSPSAFVRFNCEKNQTCHCDHWKNSHHAYEYLEIGHVPLPDQISNPQIKVYIIDNFMSTYVSRVKKQGIYTVVKGYEVGILVFVSPWN